MTDRRPRVAEVVGQCWDDAGVGYAGGGRKREFVPQATCATWDEARASRFESVEVFSPASVATRP